ncbi:14-alpha sterol demethylase [Terfezia boudieri ATCC MYA-4762]|uniref:14-alpha sterol demethylase n=1 Tax=Terfezia boudieri ATCC MYA-4762 TaxID=1051890 RepID=A0A3N4LMU6_9PEZI|nr:14-alpha sterol demethylase [Terfezia boudieri ATCC MYA-4762]
MRKVKSPMRVPNTHWVIPDNHYLMAAPGVSAIDGKYPRNPTAYDPYRGAGEKLTTEEEEEKFDSGYGLVSKGTASPYLPFGAGRHRCIGPAPPDYTHPATMIYEWRKPEK